MLRVYKLPNGRTYQYEEGHHPDGAILVEISAPQVMTPETVPAKRPARRRSTKKEQK